MSAPSAIATLEAALREKGLLPAPERAMPGAPPGRPWFVSVLLGVSGWLAGMFGLAFLVLALRPERPAAYFPIGFVLLGLSFALYRATAGAFAAQLALALSMAGHLALVYAIGATTRSATATAAAVAVLQGVWILVAPNRLARVLAASFASIAWALLVRFALQGDDLGSPSRRTALALGPALAGWIVAWGPIAAAAWALVAREIRWVAAGRQRLARPALTGLLLALAFGTVASLPQQGLVFWMPDAPPRTDWIALWPLLSLAAAVLALGCAHRLRSRALMGAAIAGALLQVFHFYLLVGTTLLVKAAIMAAVGALLVLAAIVLDRRRSAP